MGTLFKDDYNLMFVMTINYNRLSGMQGAKIQRNWSMRDLANRPCVSCDPFERVML